MGSSDLGTFFYPTSIAVIGASGQAGKLGHEIFRNLVEGGFPGALYPINPKSEQILGVPCFPNVREVPGLIDLAVLIIPASLVPGAIQECGEKGVKGAIIVSGGFAEAGPEGDELQREAANIAVRFGMRLIGPNCQGINNPYHPLCASWPLLTHKGAVAVISQSGTIGAAMMDWLSLEELGVSGFVSLGNRADVDENDLIEHFDRDPNTRVIAVYLESVKDAERFRRILESLSKPLVVLKSGRTPGGQGAAASHTKSLAGVDAVYSSLFKRYGVCRAETVEEFFDFAKGFAYLPRPAGNRILFITTSGGAAILATDIAEQEGFRVSPLPPELAAQIRTLIPPHAICANPLDLTGDADFRLFQNVIQAARPFYDILGIIFGDPVVEASQAVSPGANELVVFLGGAEVERAEKRKMLQSGIPVFPTPERAIRALAQLLSPEEKAESAKHTFPAATGRTQMSVNESLNFVRSKGFDCIVHRFAESPGKAVHHAHLIGFPISLKVDSPDVLHKSDCGGVRLNIQTPHGLRSAHDVMMRQVRAYHPEARINGVVVSAMAAPGVEVILGMNRDPQFGPIIMFGLGGITAELLRDVSMRLLPLDRTEALKMIDEIRSASLLKGFRGQQAADRNAIADGLLTLARIAEEHEDILEIDLNPVFAYPEGIVVVDARVLRA